MKQAVTARKLQMGRKCYLVQILRRVTCKTGFVVHSQIVQRIPVEKIFCSDGENDCGDDYDEQNCTGTHHSVIPCNPGNFRCGNGHGCIPSGWRCDGEVKPLTECVFSFIMLLNYQSDCLDGTDERNCTAKCPPESFECSDGQCIPMIWKVSTIIIQYLVQKSVRFLGLVRWRARMSEWV